LIERGHVVNGIFYTPMYRWPADKKLRQQALQKQSPHFSEQDFKRYDTTMDNRLLAYWNLVQHKDKVLTQLHAQGKTEFTLEDLTKGSRGYELKHIHKTAMTNPGWGKERPGKNGLERVATLVRERDQSCLKPFTSI
jgi:hypothetical protein